MPLMRRHVGVSALPNADATARNAAERHRGKLAGLRRVRPCSEVCHISSTEVRQIISKTTYVILALLVGCALRRQELASLGIETIQLREGRWVLADLEGRGRRIRTVAVPIWVKHGINAWMAAAGIEEGPLLRRIAKGGKVEVA